MQEASVLKDEEKHGAAARAAQLECDLLEVQQSMAACLQTQDLLVTQEIEAAEQQSKELQVIGSFVSRSIGYPLQVWPWAELLAMRTRLLDGKLKELIHVIHPSAHAVLGVFG